MPLVSIKQGESFEESFDLDGDAVSGWVCTINVKQYPDDAPLIKRVISAVDDEWPVLLTQFDTKKLASGQYLLIGNLTNATTKEKIQDVKRFYVSKSW